MNRPLVCVALALVASGSAPFSPPVAGAAAGPKTLPDRTIADAWTLANGLRVVTRHVPRASAVAITVCYRTGTSQDPRGGEGLASLLAEVAFTCPAAEIPARTREELGSLRPLGWDIAVRPRFTQLTEVASLAQFPGVLHQVATRMRGVTVTEDGLRVARRSVERDLATSYSRRADLALFHRLRDVAAGGEALAARYASRRGIHGLSAKEIERRIASRLTASNAVLAIAGDLSGVDSHRLIEREFGAVPSGTRLPDPPTGALRPGTHRTAFAGLDAPLGAIGIIAPALADTLHPNFYLNALLLGSYAKAKWGEPTPPLSSRFQYSILDDPDLVRFHPPTPALGDTTPVAEEFVYGMREMPPDNADSASYAKLRGGVGWLLGGPLPPDLLRRVASEPAALSTLCASTATRELWGGEAFWSAYRHRFETARTPGIPYWLAYFLSPRHRIELVLVPPK